MKTPGWFKMSAALICSAGLITLAAVEAQALEESSSRDIRAVLKIEGRCAPYFQQNMQISQPNRPMRCRARVATYHQAEEGVLKLAPFSRYIVYAKLTRRVALTMAGFSGRAFRRGRTNRFGQSRVAFMLFPSRMYLNLRIKAFQPAGAVKPGCQDLEAALLDNLAGMRSCSADSECGQPLEGLSCGASMRPVARTNADTAGFYETLNQFVSLGCDPAGLPAVSVCLVRRTDGFICSNGLCEWKYVD